jgi:hypothetical protein
MKARQRHGLPIHSCESHLENAIRNPEQWRVPKILRLTVARRRRLFTVFPCAESLVIVDGVETMNAALRVVLGAVAR